MLNRSVRYLLRPYQVGINDRIDNVYENEEEWNRFAASCVATGGGKSFIALYQIMSFGKKFEREDNGETVQVEIDKDGVINDSKMVYLAPTNEILNQFKRHFVKNVLLSIPDLDGMSIQEIDNFVRENILSEGYAGISNSKGNEIIKDDDSEQDKKDAIMRCFSPEQIDALVRRAFPNLEFGCYAGIRQKEDGTEKEEGSISAQKIADADFVILDEAHRLGAESWGKNFFNAFKNNKRAKVLAITATPNRNDDIERDMFAEIAANVYDRSSVPFEKYLTSDVFVLDAMRDGLVVSPDVSQDDSGIANSMQFKRYVELLATLEARSKITPEIEEEIARVESIVGIKTGSIRSKLIPQVFKERKKGKKEVSNDTEESFEDSDEDATLDVDDKLFTGGSKKFLGASINNPNGKYIAFIPPTPKGENPAEHLRRWMKKIKEDLKSVKGKNGEPQFSFVTSNGSIYLDKDNNPVFVDDTAKKDGLRKINNSDVIKNFEDASNKSGGIKVLISINLLNEGIHVDGIDGAIMYCRSISPIRFLQQFGRSVSSMNPHKPVGKHHKTQVIDAVGNVFSQVAKGLGKTKSVCYDSQRLQEIKTWIENNGRIPNVNATANYDGITDEKEIDKIKASAEHEARLALAIKRIQERYRHYYATGSLPFRNVNSYKALMELSKTPISMGGSEVNFWDIKIPERTISPSEKELTGAGFLEFTDGQKEFMDIYNKFTQEYEILSKSNRLNKLYRIVSVLKDYKADIELPQGIEVRGLTSKDKSSKELIRSFSSENVRNGKPISMGLIDFLKKNFDAETISSILSDLSSSGVPANNDQEVLHEGEEEKYDLGKELAFVRGLIYTGQREAKRSGFSKKQLFDSYSLSDFIKTGIIRDGKKDLELLGEMNSAYGLRCSDSGSNPNYQMHLDAAGRLEVGYMAARSLLPLGMISRFAGCSVITGEKYDKDGYDVYGFNERGYNREGFDMFGFNIHGKHRITGTSHDNRGFYYDEERGTYINRLTGSEYDALGYNIYGLNKEGFTRSRGVIQTRRENGRVVVSAVTQENCENVRGGSLSFDKPLCYYIGPDGHPDRQYGYEYQVNDGLKSVDGLGFETQTKHSTSDVRMGKSNGGMEGNYFYNNGSVIPPNRKTIPIFEHFFVGGEDAQRFNRYGYKREYVDGVERFIHRDTSNVHDIYGRVYDASTGKPVTDKKIEFAREFMKRFFEGTEEVYVSDVTRNTLREAFTIYRDQSPEAFDDSYFERIAGTDSGKAKINKFIGICPLFGEINCDKLQMSKYIRENLGYDEHEKVKNGVVDIS